MPRLNHSYSEFQGKDIPRREQGKESLGKRRNIKPQSFSGSVEVLFAEIDAIFGKKNKPHSKPKYSFLKKYATNFDANELYSELDLWILRLSETVDCLRYKVREAYQYYKRRFLQLCFKYGLLTAPKSNQPAHDSIQAVAVEIERIFGGRLRKFGAQIDLHQRVLKKQNLSADDFRNELEKLLKADKTKIYEKDVA